MELGAWAREQWRGQSTWPSFCTGQLRALPLGSSSTSHGCTQLAEETQALEWVARPQASWSSGLRGSAPPAAAVATSGRLSHAIQLWASVPGRTSCLGSVLAPFPLPEAPEAAGAARVPAFGRWAAFGCGLVSASCGGSWAPDHWETGKCSVLIPAALASPWGPVSALPALPGDGSEWLSSLFCAAPRMVALWTRC